MSKRRSEPDLDGTTTETAECNTVFVDTSLDTHLAMLVFKSDTVSDFKKKIVLEHMQCFPKITGVHIHSLKVKRKASFYHLPDSMHIWSAFHGARGNWFLLADTSSTSTCHLNPNSSELGLTKCAACHLNPNSSELGLTKCAVMDVRNVNNSCRSLSYDIDRIQQTIPISLPEMIPGITVKYSSEKTSDIQHSNFYREKSMEGKTTEQEDVCRNPSSKDSDALIYASVTDTVIVMPDVVSCGKSMVDVEGLNKPGKPTEPDIVSCGKSMVDVEGLNKPGKPTEVSGNDQSVLDNSVDFEGLFVDENSNLDSDKRKVGTVLENEIPENLMANLSKSMETDSPCKEKCTTTERKSMETDSPCTTTDSPCKEKRKTTEDVCRNPSLKDSDALFYASVTDTVMPDVVSCGKSMVDVEGLHKPGKPIEVSGLKNDQSVLDNSVDFEGLFVPAGGENSNLDSDKRKVGTVLENEIPENLMANPKEYELDQDVGLMDAQETSVNIQDTENPKSETMDIRKKQKKNKKAMMSANDDIKKSGLFQLSTGHNFVSEKRKPDEENQHSAGNGYADIPVVENSENTDNTVKKAKKKRKKKTLSTSDVQEDYLAEDQKNGTGEDSISFVKSEPDGIHEASSQVPSRQGEEKHEEKHEIAVKTDDPARTTKDKGEGINFKEFFVPCKVKNANQSSREVNNLEKVKTNGLPSVSISTEVPSSFNLSADHESKNKSRFRKDSRKRQGDSAHNSDSSRRSSRVLENGVKDCSNSKKPETSLRKPKEIIAESSTLKRKNASLVKSSLEKLPGKSGNKSSLFGLNVTNRMEFKTPKKKSLLAKPGALFKNFSGESSGDENGSAHSSGSTQSPSDSSSMSDHSIGESNSSQDSARNRSSDAQGRSTRGKGTSKLDLLDSEEMTMDMILRSSKRFKKAKLIASQNEAGQNESQLIEFVPDSLPF